MYYLYTFFISLRMTRKSIFFSPHTVTLSKKASNWSTREGFFIIK